MSKRIKKQYQPIAFSIVLIIGVLIGHFLIKTDNGISNFQIHQNSKINTILQLIQEDYVDTISQNKIEENAINSILKELDPHSTYINTKRIKGVNEEKKGSIWGIGMGAVYKYIPDYFPEEVGVVGGMVGVLGGLGGFFCPIIFGYLLEGTGLWTSCWIS